MDDYEERVRQRAHKIWQEEGCPEGRADAHWELARELVAIEENHAQTLKPNSAAAGGGEPVEFTGPAGNVGEFTTLTDQGEQQYPPSRRKRA
jgi:hypothetical protein